MIVRTLNNAKQSARRIPGQGWESVRLLLAADGMGFSFHITTIEAGAQLEMEYRNHLESVYCIQGQGRLRDMSTHAVYTIHPGTLYALDRHDRHRLEAESEMTMVCVFNPPLQGNETHDATGSYPLPATPPSGN